MAKCPFRPTGLALFTSCCLAAAVAFCALSHENENENLCVPLSQANALRRVSVIKTPASTSANGAAVVFPFLLSACAGGHGIVSWLTFCVTF